MNRDAAEIRAQYEQQGYLSALPILSPEELQQSRDAFAELERKHGEDYTAYSLHNIHKDNDWVMALAKHPRLLEVVTAVLGPDVILLDSRFICKYPVRKPESNGIINVSSDKMEAMPFVAWHQDMTYWGFDGGPVLSVWLALDDSLEDNGALQVIPGSHQSGLLPHLQSKRAGNMLSVNQEIPEELVHPEKALLCPLQAGQMSVHDGLLVHASDPNTSNRRRCGYVIRYVPTCAYPIQDPERPRSFPDTVVVSGFDKYNHFSSKL
ncbi:L-threonyl-[L-threonyl-carrier protein] 4-chlorinase [Rhinichthys klamathensis goyatoka]|uniref:L-threonyl-[L-threonyl-carrier protein] 4-chlorinase n=1 Tax=Rhinichthys klamathensis goyatoka TaxID=3034132 RepID=UPI0024B5BF54|nr:L-threonyl-[L-threonyl-carrier protein] 4-chlorinase [Rhinichthys klamathensis goyatoka]XP_056097961.1 L-threonyl-[L-threonyl-carrier protein] 4-chlorinase [Rhinichthys klamathensis goyatoka]XP_056097962.1 L-threonyl-[L-threonyl-carrier protein] 4-chlorinase [Rhinichthys klamathensis goyatoka]